MTRIIFASLIFLFSSVQAAVLSVPAQRPTYIGTSSDTKPVRGVQPGSRFLETDTNITYVWKNSSSSGASTDWVQFGNGVSLQTLVAGEDKTLNRLAIMAKDTCTNITTATTTTLKTGAGMFSRIIINKQVALGVITIYDNTAGSGTKIGTITFGSAILSDPPLTGHYGASFSTGLTVVTTAATDITVCYL